MINVCKVITYKHLHRQSDEVTTFSPWADEPDDDFVDYDEQPKDSPPLFDPASWSDGPESKETPLFATMPDRGLIWPISPIIKALTN